MNMKDVKKKVKKMYNDLEEVTDEKLISGYKNAMKDYEEKKQEQIKVAAMVIKQEIDRRGLKI